MVLLWRRRRDLNPCTLLQAYEISSHASSTTWVLLHIYNRHIITGRNIKIKVFSPVAKSVPFFPSFGRNFLSDGESDSRNNPLPHFQGTESFRRTGLPAHKEDNSRTNSWISQDQPLGGRENTRSPYFEQNHKPLHSPLFHYTINLPPLQEKRRRSPKTAPKG